MSNDSYPDRAAQDNTDVARVVTAQAIGSQMFRCPACGERMDSATLGSRCPLCDFAFGDERATGADVTPYAKAYSCGEPGWRRMAEWVCYAGRERLQHLALMRASTASRRFARFNILLLATGLGLFQATQVGWRWVTNSPAIEPTGSTLPAGRAWYHLAAAAHPLPLDQAPEIPVDLWWNPLQIVIAVITGGLAGLLLLSLAMLLTRAGLARAHSPPYRSEQRMTAAIHYSTAWSIPLFLAAVVVGFRPVSYVGAMARWPWYPPERGLVLSAAVLAAFGVTMWWFWLCRMGATAPARTRWRVVAFFTLGVPVIVLSAAAGWWYGINGLYPSLLNRLDLSF